MALDSVFTVSLPPLLSRFQVRLLAGALCLAAPAALADALSPRQALGPAGAGDVVRERHHLILPEGLRDDWQHPRFPNAVINLPSGLVPLIPPAFGPFLGNATGMPVRPAPAAPVCPDGTELPRYCAEFDGGGRNPYCRCPEVE